MKALLLSVRPEHALNILNGSKTLELRKSVPKGFKGWVYVYVTKGKPYLIKHPYHSYMAIEQKGFDDLNGTVPFRFWFDEYEEVLVQHHIDSEQIERVLKQACIEHDDLDNYVGNKETIYAWHIKNLDIFSEPMKLGEFYKTKGKYLQDYERAVLDYKNRLIESESTLKKISITKAPQSYMYVYVKEEV